MSEAPHVPFLPHTWEDTAVGCDDCGDHPAVACVNPDCPCDGDPIDLVRYDDPRDVEDASRPVPLDGCEHVWDEGEIRCKDRDCPDDPPLLTPHAHPALICSECDRIVDLQHEEDPR